MTLPKIFFSPIETADPASLKGEGIFCVFLGEPHSQVHTPRCPPKHHLGQTTSLGCVWGARGICRVAAIWLAA